MGAQGTATLDFGAFPGASDAFIDISVPGVTPTSLVEAWIRPEATADHTADEHMVETLKVFGVCTVNDFIRVYGLNTSAINGPPLLFDGQPEQGEAGGISRPMDPYPVSRNKGTRLYGTWKVAWVWN